MAWTKSGAVSPTNGSPIIYGAGTTWASSGKVRAGDVFKTGDALYEVLSVQSNTQLTLTSPYLGVTAIDQTYALIHTGLLPAELAVGVSEMTAKNVLAMSQLFDWETSVAATVPMTNPATQVTSQVKPIAGLVADIDVAKAAINELDTEKAPKASPTFSGPVTLPQTINVTQPYGALQVGGVDVLRFGGAAGDNSGHLAGFRNLIINGSGRIQQRGASGVLIAGSSAYTIDRWLGFCIGSNINWNNGTGENGGNTHFFTGAAGNTALLIQQRVESSNCNGLSGATVTFSALMWSDVTKNITLDLSYANALDNFNATTSIGSVPKTIASGFTYVSATFNNLPAGVLNGLLVQIGFGVSTSGHYGFSQVQLELGSISTLFDQRPIGLELALCQRYYQSIRCGASFYASVLGQVSSSSVYFTPMRAIPSTTRTNGVFSNVSSITFTAESANSGRLEIAATVAGDSYSIGNVVTLSAEL